MSGTLKIRIAAVSVVMGVFLVASGLYQLTIG
jgi:hypothetical protein